MSDQQGKIREIDWLELFPWLILLRSIRIAISLRVLVLGALGLIVTTLGWKLISVPFSGTDDPVIAEWRATACDWIWEQSPEFAVATSPQNAEDVFTSAGSGLVEAPVSVWLFLTRPFTNLFHGDLTLTGFLCMLLCCVWELLVWGLAGGAISRIAALRFTRGEAPDLLGALRHAARKLSSYSVAPLVALAGAAVFAVQLLVLGWIMRLSILALLVGVLWPFALLLGLLMTILLIGALIGWPLMWSTVSVEGTDAFDALSRSYAYTYQRPLRLLWYVAFAALLAAISMFVVKLFATTTISLADWSISWGLDEQTMHTVVAPHGDMEEGPALFLPPPIDPSEMSDGSPNENGLSVTEVDEETGDVIVPTEPAKGAARTGRILGAAAWAVAFWKSLLAALAAGYQAGFLFVAAVGIYLLLRKDIDGAEMDEVYIEEEQDFGMPSLEGDDATGVPEVAPHDAAQPGDTGAQPDDAAQENSASENSDPQ